MLPLAVNLVDRPVVVIGAGAIGAGKARLLVEAGARVSVIAREILVTPPEGIVSIDNRSYRDGDLAPYVLCVAATGDPVTNDRIVDEARRTRTWLNVVDDPARSDFYFTAVHRDGDVVVSVSTQGASPALAQVIRTMVRDRLPSHLGEAAAILRGERDALHARGESTEGYSWQARISQLLDHGDDWPTSKRTD